MADLMADFDDKFLMTDDGLRLHYRDFHRQSGAAAAAHPAPPVICLPGLTRTSRDFTAIATTLSTSFRVLCPSMRGRGRSDWDDQPDRYSPMTYLQDTLTLMRTEGIERAHFIGTSMGGIMIMLLSQLAGDSIAAAVINDVGPELDPVGLRRIMESKPPERPATTWPEAVALCKAAALPIFPHYTDAQWEALTRMGYAERGGFVVPDCDPAIITQINRDPETANPDLWPFFQGLTDKPLLVIRGGISDFFADTTLQAMHAAHPSMRSVTVPGVGHAPMLDEPEARDAVVSFLQAQIHSGPNPVPA